MLRFTATARMKGEYESLEAVVLVAGGRVKVEAASMELGDWALSEIELGRQLDGFHLTVDNEELVLGVTDADAFARAVDAERKPRLLPRLGNRADSRAPEPAIPEPPEAEAGALPTQLASPSRSRGTSRPHRPRPRRRSVGTLPAVGEIAKAIVAKSVQRFHAIPPRWKLIGAGVGTLGVTWLVFPWIVILGLWGVAAASLLTATLGAVDPFVAVRLPDWALPVRLFSIGLGIVFLLLLLAFI